MRIGLLGDVHGNTAWAKYAANRFYRESIKTVLQVGDFGVYPDQALAKRWKKVNEYLKKTGQTWYVAPGNHEDYDYINSIPVREDGFQQFKSNMLLATRGQRFELDGRSVLALGGAPSVDRMTRMRWKGKHWWAEEAITEEDAERAMAGGHADIMFAHDAPFVPSIDARIADNPMGFDEVDLHYAREGRKVMDRVVNHVQPKVFLHGHYHFPVNEVIKTGSVFSADEHLLDTHVVGLNKDMANYSLGVLDTETLEVVTWDLTIDYTAYTMGKFDDYN